MIKVATSVAEVPLLIILQSPWDWCGRAGSPGVQHRPARGHPH